MPFLPWPPSARRSGGAHDPEASAAGNARSARTSAGCGGGCGAGLACRPSSAQRMRLSARSAAIGAYFGDIRHLACRDWEVGPKAGGNLPMSSGPATPGCQARWCRYPPASDVSPGQPCHPRSPGPAISAFYWPSGTDQGLPLWPEHLSGPTMVAMVNIAEPAAGPIVATNRAYGRQPTHRDGALGRVPGRSPARPAHYKGVASC